MVTVILEKGHNYSNLLFLSALSHFALQVFEFFDPLLLFLGVAPTLLKLLANKLQLAH